MQNFFQNLNFFPTGTNLFQRPMLTHAKRVLERGSWKGIELFKEISAVLWFH
jgi:hypothetical protein